MLMPMLAPYSKAPRVAMLLVVADPGGHADRHQGRSGEEHRDAAVPILTRPAKKRIEMELTTMMVLKDPL